MAKEHKASTLGERHAPHNWEYADATARAAATGMVPDDVGNLARQLDDNSLWLLSDDSPVTWVAVAGAGGGGGGAVDSVNGQTGVVVLDPDDLDDSATTNKFTTAAEITKLAGIEALADVTDATNVAAAGAVMEADTTTAAMSFVIDEDSFASDLATKVPTQQSVKAYVDAKTKTFYDLQVIIDGGGAAIAAGQEVRVRVPHAGVPIAVYAVADQSGSQVVDIWREDWTDVLAGNLPANADTITNAHEPTLSAAVAMEDTGLTDWGAGSGATLAAGDVLTWHVDSSSTVQQVTWVLRIQFS